MLLGKMRMKRSPVYSRIFAPLSICLCLTFILTACGGGGGGAGGASLPADEYTTHNPGGWAAEQTTAVLRQKTVAAHHPAVLPHPAVQPLFFQAELLLVFQVTNTTDIVMKTLHNS